MDNFIVSARKYRPLTFDSVVGQGSITNTLKNAIKSNHLAHAYLFCGPRGIGKTTCARIFAKTINCSNLTSEMEACGTCESCLSFAENRSYNIHELDAASNNSVDDIRNLTDQVRIPPQIGKYSVYIIDEVHMLSQQAFNAFLKTLEEPPQHAIFILATTEKHKIIPTILSRCQIYDFNRMGIDSMVQHLENIAKKENITYEIEAFNIIAQKADGAMRDALSIFDQIVSFSGNNITYQKVIENLNILDYEYYFKLIDSFLNGNLSDALLIFNDILNNGFDAHNFINGLSKHLRDLLIIKDQNTLKLIEVGPSIKEKYKEQTVKCSGEFLFESLDITYNCDLNYKISKDKRLHVELALVKLSNLIQVQKKKSEISIEKKSDIGENDSDKEKKEKKKSDTTSNEKDSDKIKITKKSTPSIKEAFIDVSDIEKEIKIKNEESIDKKEEKSEEQFKVEDLIHKWQQYAENLKNENMRMHIALKNRQPELKEGHKIEVKMDNSAQEEDFNKEIKPNLVVYLRKELHNDKIEINTIVIGMETAPRRAYTDSDKFEYLSKKNPTLTKLKNDFNLDFE